MLEIYGILLLGLVVYLNTPKFGHLPDKISRFKINRSSHQKHGHFANLHNTPKMTGKGGFWRVMFDFYFGSHPHTKPSQNIPAHKINWSEWNRRDNIAVWFGHSSYLIRLHQKNYLIDPVFSANASPLPHNVVPFLGTNLYHTEDLPDIDYLIITHDHWDHLDYPTVKKLQPKVKKVITGLGVGSHFRHWGYNHDKIIEMDWNESININNIQINCLPARHFSGRSIFANRTLWASFLIISKDYKFYIGGDSGYDNHYKIINQKFGPLDIAFLEAGQYDRNWRYIHSMPEETIQAAVDLQTHNLFPVHNSKFSICNHPWYEPLQKIYELSPQSAFKLLTPQIGEIVELQNDRQTFSAWWKGIK